MTHYYFMNGFFSDTINSEGAIGCTIYFPEIMSSFNQTFCRAESWSDGRRSSTCLLADTLCPHIYLSPQESRAARPGTRLRQLSENLADLLFYQHLV